MQVVTSYLKHESGKFGGRLYGAPLADIDAWCSPRHTNAVVRFREVLASNHDVGAVIRSLPLEERWLLFHAVSFGCLRKELANAIGYPGLGWALEDVRLADLKFETPVGPLCEIGVATPTLSEAVRHLGTDGGSDRDPHASTDPLIGRQVGSSVRIHDGNGRLLSHAYAVRDGLASLSTTVAVWVGRSREVAGLDESLYRRARVTLFPTVIGPPDPASS